MCPDHVPWSIRVKRSWETLSNASARAEQGVTLLKYSNAMRYIHSGSGRESYLPKEILCLFLCGLPPRRISCLMTEEAPQRDHNVREVFNGSRWIGRAGAAWRLMPHDVPPWH